MEEMRKIVAVMGSPSAGATTTSIKLATALARKKQNVIIISLDPTCPMIPYVLPSDTKHQVSLGELLTKMQVTQDDILGALVMGGKNNHISVLSYKLGESQSSYPKLVPSRVVDFFTMVQGLADYIIIDCATVIEFDVATIVALQYADVVLEVGTADLKGIAYHYTMQRLLADSKFQKERHIRVIGKLKEGQEYEAVAQQYGGIYEYIPYCEELELQGLELSLFEPLQEEESLFYNRVIKKIGRELFLLELGKVEPKKRVVEKDKQEKKDKKLFSFGKRKGEF